MKAVKVAVLAAPCNVLATPCGMSAASHGVSATMRGILTLILKSFFCKEKKGITRWPPLKSDNNHFFWSLPLLSVIQIKSAYLTFSIYNKKKLQFICLFVVHFSSYTFTCFCYLTPYKKVFFLIDKSMQQIRSDSNSGGLKNQEKISQLCAVGISFPTKGTSFMWKNYRIWSLIHRDILSLNIFDK